MSCSHRVSCTLLILGLALVAGCSDHLRENNSTAPVDQTRPADPTDDSESSSLVTEEEQTIQPLARLNPAATLSGSKVSRNGSRSTAQVRVTNTSERIIDTVRIHLVRLGTDGQFLKTIPHGGIVPQGAGGIHLAKGESETFDIHEMFLSDHVAAVEAIITEIKYTDGTKWPLMPSGFIRKENADPVTIRMIGYLASDAYSEAVLACANSSSKPVNSISWVIRYFDKDGKELHSTSGGQGGDWSIDPGQGDVLTGGDGPPKHTDEAKVMIRRVVFTDGSTWKPAGK